MNLYKSINICVYRAVRSHDVMNTYSCTHTHTHTHMTSWIDTQQDTHTCRHGLTHSIYNNLIVSVLYSFSSNFNLWIKALKCLPSIIRQLYWSMTYYTGLGPITLTGLGPITLV